MKRALSVLGILLIAVFTNAQKLTMPELYSLLDLSNDKIDTLMKQKKYRLLQKDIDSTSSQLYYNNLERNPEGPDWVRSVTCVDVVIKDIRSRLVTYRTYRKKEYEEILAWFLRNGFMTRNKEEFKNGDTHITYSDGSKSVLVKTEKQQLPSGVKVLSYEFEIGK